MENIVFILICFLCATLFLLLGIYALKKKTPINFWSGKTVRSEEVTNIIEYNKENSIMWIAYSAFYWAAGLTGFFSRPYLDIVILLLSVFPGFLLLVLNYKRIEKKYLVK